MTALATPRLGKDSKLYINNGTYASPSLTEFKNCKGLKAPNSMGEDDVSSRITGGIEAVVMTLQKLGLTFQMHDDDGVDITAIRTAYNSRSVVEFFVMNGAVTSSAARGVRMTCQVAKFDQSQDNDKANVFDVEIKPTWPDAAAPASAVPVVGGNSWTVA